MPILKKLYEKITKDNTFIEHDPTHPEYPDFVTDFCYRLKSASKTGMFNDLTSYIAVSFVYPNYLKNKELGFNFNFVVSLALQGGAQLSFLTKADAENFAKTYVSEKVIPYISRGVLKLVRIDSHSDIPCYVTSSFLPGTMSTTDRPRKMSPNLFDRMTKKPITYQSNPFSSHDADLNVKRTKALKNNAELISQIDEKLESLKKICNNIEVLVDYKNTDISLINNKLIARGETDKKLKDIFNSAWHYGKGDVLSVSLMTGRTNAYFFLKSMEAIFTFNLDILPDEIKNMFSEKVFLQLLVNNLTKIYGYQQKNASERHYILNSYSREVFVIQEKSIEFNVRNIVNIFHIENIEDVINKINEAATNIKKAINIAAADVPKATFTVDDFDSEEEE